MSSPDPVEIFFPPSKGWTSLEDLMSALYQSVQQAHQETLHAATVASDGGDIPVVQKVKMDLPLEIHFGETAASTRVRLPSEARKYDVNFRNTHLGHISFAFELVL